MIDGAPARPFKLEGVREFSAEGLICHRLRADSIFRHLSGGWVGDEIDCDPSTARALTDVLAARMVTVLHGQHEIRCPPHFTRPF